MTEKSIKKNYIFNLIYQLVTWLTPIITTPYLTSVLGPEGIGLYSYSNSLISYFTLFALLGTALFGTKLIGASANDPVERSRDFYELFLFRLITSSIALAVYLIVFCAILQENTLLFLILAINIVNVVVDITWFFQGMEDFSKIATRSIVVRLLSVVGIFLFVKNVGDLHIYVLLSVGLILLGNVFLWFSLPKYLVKVKGIKPFRNVKTILQLFLPTVAIQIYTILDKSMIGWFSPTTAENGYYEEAEKIVRMVLMAITSLSTVMVPRTARMFKEGDFEGVRAYTYKSYAFTLLLAVPMTLGLTAVASHLVPLYLGEAFAKAIPLLQLFSWLLVFVGVSNVTGIQYFVPCGKQNVLTLTVTVGAVINFLLNLILIPKFYALGACIASAVAEFAVMATGLIYLCKKDGFKMRTLFGQSYKYAIAGGVMFALLWIVKRFLKVTVLNLVLLVGLGACCYFALLLLLREKLFFQVVGKVWSKLKRKKTDESEEK